MARKVLDFHPEVHGFQFTNSWRWTPAQADQAVRTIERFVPAAIFAMLGLGLPIISILPVIGPLAVVAFPIFLIWLAAGGAKEIAKGFIDPMAAAAAPYGMCGGMTHAAIDYFMNDMMIPGIRHTPADLPGSRPQADDELRSFIFDRLIDTFVTDGIDMLVWHSALNDAANYANAPEMPWAGPVADQVDKVKRRIDKGEPATLAIFYDVPELGKQHQILAYGYEEMTALSTATKTMTRIFVYDPNRPRQPHHMDVTTDRQTGRSLITTTFSTAGATSNWLGIFLTVAYSAKTPPSADLVVDTFIARPAGRWLGHRIGQQSLVTIAFLYRGAGQSIEFAPALELISGPKGATAPGRATTPSGASQTVTVPAFNPLSRIWLHRPSGEPGYRKLRIVAERLLSSNWGGATPFRWRREIEIAGTGSAEWDLSVGSMISRSASPLTAAGPTAAPSGGLQYSLTMNAPSGLSAGATYDWSVGQAQSASVSLSSSRGQSVSGQAYVDPRAPRPSLADVVVTGEASGGGAFLHVFEINLPRGEIQLKALPDTSRPFGEPRRAAQSWPGAASAQPIIWERSYSAAFVEVTWTHLTSTPTKIRWMTSLSAKVFEIVQPITGNSAQLPVSLIADGTLSPGPGTVTIGGGGVTLGERGRSIGLIEPGPVAIAFPQSAIVKVEVMDDGGQHIDHTVRVPVVYPVGSYLKTALNPSATADVNSLKTDVAAILTSARAQLEGANYQRAFGRQPVVPEGRSVTDFERLTISSYREALETLSGPESLEHAAFEDIDPDETVIAQPSDGTLASLAPATLEHGPMEAHATPEATEYAGVVVVGKVGYSRPGDRNLAASGFQP